MAGTAPLTLREGDRGRLEALVRSVSARPSLAQRARIVLMSAEGLTNTEIARRTGSTRPTVISWRNRYATGGINALGDLPRPGRPAVVDELEVVATTLAHGGRPPAHLGVGHWSSRLLGQQLGISFATVARIWRKWGIQPDHVETFTFSTDLERQAQARDLSGLYRNPSQRAAALHRTVPASVRSLIDALGALSAGWQDDRPEPSVQTSAAEDTAETLVGDLDRQTISDTQHDPQKGSSRLVESGVSKDLDRSAGRARGSKSMRAEFHGTRGRRSRPTSSPGN